MAKKINTKKLIEKIEKITKEKLREQNVVSLTDYRGLSKRSEPKTVLLVEDDDAVRRSIEKILKKDGYKVLSAADGTQLSEVIDDDTAIELVILDIGLPWINGFELAKLLKEHEDLREIPLIFVSAQGTDMDIKKGFEVGADDFIKKPFEAEELRRSVNTLMKLNEK